MRPAAVNWPAPKPAWSSVTCVVGPQVLAASVGATGRVHWATVWVVCGSPDT
jgi:hypothetical protein